MSSPTTAGELQPFVDGDLIDSRYRLIDLLRRAEANEFWRAHDSRLGRDVMIELVHACGESVSTSDQLQGMLRQRYRHVYDAGIQARPAGSCAFVVATLLVDAPPLPVGRWQVPSGSHRAPRSWRLRKAEGASRR